MPESPHEHVTPGLQPPQFRLRTMFWFIALLCAVFALMGTVGPLGAAALVLFVLAAIAHVAGNSLGTRLRASGDQSHATGAGDKATRPGSLSENDYAPKSKLAERYSLGATIVVLTTLGVILGAGGGGFGLALLNWERLTWPALVLAGVACGVLGGLIGFCASSFVHVLLGAQLQALRGARRR